MAERDAAVARCARLEHLLSVARNAQYGRSSEKLNDDQLRFALEDVERAVAAVEAEENRSNPTKSRERAATRRANRGALPEHLPRIVETIAPDDTACPCCSAPMHEIGADESQRLDIVPAQYRVIVTRRPKLVCRNCAGQIVQAAAPERLIKGGLPTERLVAHVLAAKYAWHLPLYRQSQIMATQGLAIDRSTLAFWVGYAGAELAPVYRHMKANLLASSKIVVDETPAPVLDPGRGRTKTGYFWAIARDDRPWRGPEPPGVVYSYAPGRGAVHALKLLDGMPASCNATAMPPTKRSSIPRAIAASRSTSNSLSAGRICAAASWRSSAEVPLQPRGGPEPDRTALWHRAQPAWPHGRGAARRPAGDAKPLVIALKTWFEERLKTSRARA